MPDRKPAPPPKRPPGRPTTDPAGVMQPRQVKLTPTEIGHLRAAYGSISGGLRRLVERDMAAAPK